jgi:hypothetical protein
MMMHCMLSSIPVLVMVLDDVEGNGFLADAELGANHLISETRSMESRFSDEIVWNHAKVQGTDT